PFVAQSRSAGASALTVRPEVKQTKNERPSNDARDPELPSLRCTVRVASYLQHLVRQDLLRPRVRLKGWLGRRSTRLSQLFTPRHNVESQGNAALAILGHAKGAAD